jgi:polar amino acid transport system substrate-binding protein
MKTGQILIMTLVVVVVVALGVVAGLALFRSLSQPEPTAKAQDDATGTPPSPPPPALAPPSPPAGGDPWPRIQATGTFVVGTSADYPPFEYLTDEFQIDGFDIALMDEIARRLGVRAEYRNLAFDGLGAALQVAQIDAAIAAISDTPEREAELDFSNVYFAGEDGILGRAGGEIQPIAAVEQMAGYRVGVQRGTVYESWLQEALIGSGQMPPGNLYAFETVQDALRDLEQGRIDLVVLDIHPAEVAVAPGGFELVGHGLYPQRYAIALPKGAVSLKAELDRVLTELNSEGVIAALAQEYMGLQPADILTPPPPAPAPEGTVTDTTPGACTDSLALMSHISYDDQNMTQPPILDPGERFTKGWRVQNTGTCTWDSGYRLVFVSGNASGARMGGAPAAVQAQVGINASYDANVYLVAPLKPGTYQGFWQMENGQGQPFGERLPVGIRVPAAPTITPAPTQTPAPGITFGADRTQIQAGECVTFAWQVEEPQGVYLYGEGERWQVHSVARAGRQQECPPMTTVYSLRVVRQDNSVEVRQIPIYVEFAPDTPYVQRFTADPPNQVTLGQCVRLRWKVEGTVSRVSITANGAPMWADAPTEGSYDHCPDIVGLVGYGIAATGPGGTSRAQENVRVLAATTATPLPTVAPELPVVHTFAVTPNQIPVGGCVSISWRTGGATVRVTVLRGQDVVLDEAPLTGSAQDCPATAGTAEYAIVAYNAAGQSETRRETVQVSEATSSNPLAGTVWQATAYYDGFQSTPTFARTLLTVAFAADGSLQGSAGCNTYSGSYLVDGDQLAISALEAGNQLCNEPAGVMDQEAAFLADLGTADSFRVEGGKLVLSDASGQVVLETTAHTP